MEKLIILWIPLMSYMYKNSVKIISTLFYIIW